MRTITRHPVTPAEQGVIVTIPAGGRILSVTQSINSFYLHVLGETSQQDWDQHRICAYMDEALVPEGQLGEFIGTTERPGTSHCCHFFDAGVVGVTL